MSTETQKVDVLHVMREASAILIRDGHKGIPEDLLNAHDAVAELIEAVKENRQLTEAFA